MTTRKDTHCPKNFGPGEYTYKGVFSYGSWCRNIDDRINGFDIREALRDNGWADGNFKDKGTCDHCGARFGYGSVFTHTPTGDLVTVGWKCADDRFECTSKADLDQKRARKAAKKARAVTRFIEAQDDAEDIMVALDLDHELTTDIRERCYSKGRMSRAQANLVLKLYREATTGKTDWARFVADKGAEFAAAVKVDHHIIRDIASKGERYGKVSDAQAAFILKLAREAETARPVTEGRRLLRGEVTTLRWQDPYCYSARATLKVLVTTTEGEKVWGSVPRDFEEDVEVGHLVEFKGTVTRSKNDDTFGLFKRPTNFRIVSADTAADLVDHVPDECAECGSPDILVYN